MPGVRRHQTGSAERGQRSTNGIRRGAPCTATAVTASRRTTTTPPRSPIRSTAAAAPGRTDSRSVFTSRLPLKSLECPLTAWHIMFWVPGLHNGRKCGAHTEISLVVERCLCRGHDQLHSTFIRYLPKRATVVSHLRGRSRATLQAGTHDGPILIGQGRSAAVPLRSAAVRADFLCSESRSSHLMADLPNVSSASSISDSPTPPAPLAHKFLLLLNLFITVMVGPSDDSWCSHPGAYKWRPMRC